MRAYALYLGIVAVLVAVLLFPYIRDVRGLSHRLGQTVVCERVVHGTEAYAENCEYKEVP